MKNILVTLLFSLVLMGVGNSQHFIGMHKDEIMKEMKQVMPDFKIDNSTVNKLYKYLKYVDDINEQTLLIFLDENDRCTFSKLMSDYSNLDDAIKKLNNKYKKVKQNEWVYSLEKVSYSVILKEEEWFFTIETKKKK